MAMMGPPQGMPPKQLMQMLATLMLNKRLQQNGGPPPGPPMDPMSMQMPDQMPPQDGPQGKMAQLAQMLMAAQQR